MSAKKYLKINNGVMTEESAIVISAGSADEGKIPALNVNGVLEASIVDSVQASLGADSAGKRVELDGAGRIDSTMMPIGVGADTAVITATENLAAGDLVNVWNNSGSFNVRKADATTPGKEAHGFVTSVVASGAPATVYFEGSNTGVVGLLPGRQYLSTTAGLSSSVAPSGAGNIVQLVGVAISATSLNLQITPPVTLV